MAKTPPKPTGDKVQVYLSQTYGIYMEFKTETGLEYEKIKASKGQPLIVGYA